MNRRGVWVMVCGALIALGVHGDAWRLYHLARVFVP